LTGGGLTGCAEQDPINRVQPDYIKKSDLIGPDSSKPYEWYIRNTVVDTTRSNGFAFPGLQDELKRVRWDIEENSLVARRSYEVVSGADGKGANPAHNDGIVVASYPIQHFDIRREYNRATGEELNVIVENMERPWYEREYIRVNWAQNQVTDPEGLFWFDKIFGDAMFKPTGYMENNPKSPMAPVYQTDKGYLDVTVKMSAATSTLFGIPGLPACALMNWITGSDVQECNEQELSVRTSFMRVPDRDYEALETDSSKWAMFGTFNRDRYGFSRQYEILDKHWHRMVGRHNLWKKSHTDKNECFAPQPGEDVETSRKAADDKCESQHGAGSRCDLFAGDSVGTKGLCTIPLQKREVRTVAYHVSRGMPGDLWETNKELIAEWNDALITAIAVGREVECRKGGGDKDSCHNEWFDGERPKALNGPALVVCHNPVQKGDNEACGPENTSAREGDLRFNLLGWVEQPLAASPLGYGPNGADPLTGEVVQSTAYQYGAPLDSYATMARDLIKVTTGDLDPAAFALGTNVGGSLDKYKSEGKIELFQPYAQYMKGQAQNLAVTSGRTDEQIQKAVSAVNAKDAVARIGANPQGSPTERLAAVQGAIAQRGVEGARGFGGKMEALSRSQATAARLAGSQSEANLIGSNDWLSANAMPVPTSLGLDVVEAARKASSPFQGNMSPFALTELQNKMNAALEARGECMYGVNEFNAPHFEGLAKRIAQQFGSVKDNSDWDDQVFRYLRKMIYKGVTLHEVGHTMSMRHNFQGSWDSMNFHSNYWKLRTKGGAASAACTTARAPNAPDNCMGPRYLDPESADEMGMGAQPHPGIEEYAYSSIMDYGYDFNTDLMGLGNYDRAMMKFVYGNAVETFQPNSQVAKRLASLHAIPGTTTPRGPISEQWWVKRQDSNVGGGDVVQPTHYTTMARILQQEKLLFDPARCREPRAEIGEGYGAIDGQICDAPLKDHAHVSQLKSGEVEKGVQGNLFQTDDGRIRWPYRFGTDEYSNHPHNLRFDAGADVYEAAVSVSKLYEYRYILDFWRRGKRGYLSWFIGNRMWDRYFSRMHSIGWLAASKITMYAAMSAPSVTPNAQLLSDDWGRGYVLAAETLFSTMQRAIMRPQVGFHEEKQVGFPAEDFQPGGTTLPIFEVPDSDDARSRTTGVSVLEGRWIDDDLNNAKGGSYHYQSFHDRAGTHVEKPIAMAALAAQFPPIDTYYSRDTYVDGRNMLLNFRSVFPEAYDRLMAGVMGSDSDVFAPYAVGNGNARTPITVQYPNLQDSSFRLPNNAKVIDPLIGFRLQVPTLYYTLWMGEDDGTRSYQNSLRLWVEGSPEGVTLPDSEKTFFYEVSSQGGSGILWAARNFGTETLNGTFVRPKGIGHRMLYHANRLLADTYAVQRTADGLPVYDANHRPVWEAGKENQLRDTSEIQRAARLQEYKRYLGLLNVTRMVMWDLRADLKGW
jgi:hypothetical protein